MTAEQNDSPTEDRLPDSRAVFSRRGALRMMLAGGGTMILGPGLLAACGSDSGGSGNSGAGSGSAGSGSGGSTGGSGGGSTASGSGAGGTTGTAGQGTPKSGGTLTIAEDADPIGLNPHTTPAFSSFDFLALLFNGLLRWSPKMEPEPDLAESFDNPDETTYVFHLRKGVKFHNGQDFTADDVKYTFDYIFDAKNGSRHATTFATIKAVTVVDPYTVKFELKTPDAAFLSYMATCPDGVIMPKGVANQDTKPVGTGPFVFDSYTPNQQLVMKKFDDYYEKDLPYLDSVVCKFFKDQSSITSALRSKDVDMTWLKDPKIAAQVADGQPDIVSAPGKDSRTFPVWLNQSKKPLDDVNVRRALSLATDRKACVQTVLAGSGEVGALIPKSMVGGLDEKAALELPNYGHDVDKAKQLLADAGYPDGVDLGDYIVVAANGLDVQCSQILQQQWAQAGIKVNLKPMETAPLLADWKNGDYGILSVALSWTPDPDDICARLLTTNAYGKAMGQTDTHYDDLVHAARQELDNDKRAADYLEIQKLVADQVFNLEIYQYPLRWEMWWDYVKGYVALPANIRSYVRTAWLEQ